MNDLEGRRIFLIACESAATNAQLETMIKAQIPKAHIFVAADGMEALFKFENVPAHIVILDSRLPKLSATEFAEKLIHRKDKVAVIILGPTEPPESLMDQVATGQVQFLSQVESLDMFHTHINRALNWLVDGKNTAYRLRFLTAGEHLLKVGEPAEHVYLVKSGELKAYKTSPSKEEVILGTVRGGEFVGEMAYINGEPRSANVIALTDCELIEIPNLALDAVLFSKPAWSKALMKTLSKRLKVSNEIR